ncbi:MAG TPA: zf-HC2 domain-containing protein [Longimicrobiales bacterium]|nr:zf-HC2 domain-containing protein [Longimicrobiales bacterium]
MNCQEALQRLYEYLDGELTPETSDEVRRHVDICAACYPEVKATREFREILHSAAEGQPLCPDPLRERIRQLLEQDAERPDSDSA